jgi:hypothetical protein
MPMFKVMIEDFTVYGCTIEAEDQDEANERFQEELEQNDYDYYKTCEAFDGVRDYDGSVEVTWYDDE